MDKSLQFNVHIFIYFSIIMQSVLKKETGLGKVLFYNKKLNANQVNTQI